MVESNSSSLGCAILPDDVLRLIFTELSTEDRIPLSLVSKRFRSLDLDVGKRVFNDIFVSLTKETDMIEILCGSGIYRFEAPSNGEYCHNSPHIGQYFRRATAKSLNICIGDGRDSRASLALSSVFSSLQCDKRRIHFESSTDSSDVAFSFFNQLKIRNSRLNQLELLWLCNTHQNLPRLRDSLQQLPVTERLEISYRVKIGQEESWMWSGRSTRTIFDETSASSLIDDQTLIILTSSVVHLSILSSIDCSAQGIIHAFEIICASQIDEKFISMDVSDSVVSEIFRIAKEKDEFKISELYGLRSMEDSNRFAVLRVGTKRSLENTPIEMFRINEHGQPLAKRY